MIASIKLFTCIKHNYTESKKNNTDVAHYNFNVHQLILVIFGKDVTERMLSNGGLLSYLS